MLLADKKKEEISNAIQRTSIRHQSTPSSRVNAKHQSHTFKASPHTDKRPNKMSLHPCTLFPLGEYLVITNAHIICLTSACLWVRSFFFCRQTNNVNQRMTLHIANKKKFEQSSDCRCVLQCTISRNYSSTSLRPILAKPATLCCVPHYGISSF